MKLIQMKSWSLPQPWGPWNPTNKGEVLLGELSFCNSNCLIKKVVTSWRVLSPPSPFTTFVTGIDEVILVNCWTILEVVWKQLDSTVIAKAKDEEREVMVDVERGKRNNFAADNLVCFWDCFETFYSEEQRVDDQAELSRKTKCGIMIYMVNRSSKINYATTKFNFKKLRKIVKGTLYTKYD